jgi:GTP-binding protein Era
LVDAEHGITDTIRQIAELKSDAPFFAAINKVDAVKKENLLPLARDLSGMRDFREIFMVSALKGQGIAPMLKSLASVMPESPLLFEPRDLVDVPDELWLAEITRENIYRFIHQELPYHIHVSTDQIETADDGVVEIAQTIYVRTDGHKKIVIGTGGTQLKRIGTAARHEMQDEWGVNARLKLMVRVEDWESRPERYSEQGLEYVK